ncbi:MAG: UPF0182 family protein [Acidobacteria bacterium]|nr:MAG: UPF0182 family protein [Acidobacteriota bacterium]
MRRETLTRWLLAALLLLFILGPLFSNGIDLIVDWLWFKQEGFAVIYKTILQAQIRLSGYAGVGFMAVLAVNLWAAQALSRRNRMRVYDEVVELPVLGRVSSALRGAVWVGMLVVGYFVGQWAMSHWSDYLLATHAQATGTEDPLFAVAAVIACAISATFMYFIEGGVWITPRGATMVPAARSHLLVLGGLLFVLIAYRFKLAEYSLLFSPRGVLYGAGYTEVNASLPVINILIVLSLATTLAFLAGAFQGGRLRLAAWAVATLALVGFLGGSVYPELIQRFVVAPNEIDKEQPYIRSAIEFTRQAYALDRFEEREFSVGEDLTLADIKKNDATMRNIRLWDHKPLLTTFAQLQELRPYYDFEAVDNDRYWIHGTYRQVSLSPRELSSRNLPRSGWINEHLLYTHGYGLCMSPVNESTPDGLPAFFIKDIPPVSSVPIGVTRPEIYFGETANDYCFVHTHQQEFDYPAGDHDIYATYKGEGGLPLGGLLRRLLFALKFGEKNIFFSTDLGPDSRLMLYRQTRARVGRLLPFLVFDRDPYMVVRDDGSLVWMLDGYTTSEMYPYSEPFGEMGNYIRNSVKATVSAYDGHVRYYVSDPEDPLIQAWSRIFPGIFLPFDSMPKDLRAHVRYPEDFFSIQASMYAVFHMRDPRVFYNKEDLWRVANSNARGGESAMSPYYTIMKLAEVGKTEEFILMVPFTPARKDNMIAWMAARCDVPNYGRVLVFTFPKQKLVFGPQQLESRIDQDPAISQALTLWGQGGSSVIRGTLLVIPVNNSVLYIEPLYLAASAGGGLPQLKRVIVSYTDQVVMEPTFDDALARIFGGAVSTAAAAPTPPGGITPGAKSSAAPPADIQSLIKEAGQHYDRAQQLLRQGDWAGYGEEMKKLGEVLNKLAAQQK